MKRSHTADVTLHFVAKHHGRSSDCPQQCIDACSVDNTVHFMDESQAKCIAHDIFSNLLVT